MYVKKRSKNEKRLHIVIQVENRQCLKRQIKLPILKFSLSLKSYNQCVFQGIYPKCHNLYIDILLLKFIFKRNSQNEFCIMVQKEVIVNKILASEKNLSREFRFLQLGRKIRSKLVTRSRELSRAPFNEAELSPLAQQIELFYNLSQPGDGSGCLDYVRITARQMSSTRDEAPSQR